ncbi:SusD/RagB family nutrient-binding outer membrane lipoprotein [Pedobacter nutrimenti]|uniref:SusD-like starch-binding protein associating with outer membrane n=1 Tax=Pedobacter nutrimenti TaxID=1241337 RepID=A0A318USY3_9SPHI|nr:SusD/RagB family nutrient-binding outer membrane lipoprotein [Pedobacter nutrimenti]PYF77205.1 SusD-like starch-binding protein associating with outer membrane [Pedobacter nutrimenti]
MKTKIYTIFTCLMILLFSSCKKTEDLQKDPSAILNAAPKLIFTGLLLNSSQSPWNTDQRHNQFMVMNEAYYGNQSYGWTTADYGVYTQLRNVQRMEIEAQKVGAPAVAYLALAKFFRAYFFIAATDMFGDVPMSEALKGANENNFAPKYDLQKDVYNQCLKLLEDANTDLTPLVTNQTKVEGDFFYNGDLSKWQKLVNSFRLRVLIGLSKRADDTPELNIKGQFASMVANPQKYPLILTNADNFQLVYNTSNVSNNYPLWPSNGVVLKNDLRNNLGATYVNILTRTNDPRLFVVALPTDSARLSGDAGYATKFSSFKGGKTGELQTTLKDQAIAGKLSMINFDYWLSSPSGIPCVQLGASETNFNLAEGINRGWATGNATTYYEQGITESIKFYGQNNPTVISAFLTKNAYMGNTTDGLTQILEQKYVAFFENSGLQAYYNYRRTGIPKFDIGPANANNNQIPVRWAYPTIEYTVNTANLKAAIQRQFAGADNQNGVTWAIK